MMRYERIRQVIELLTEIVWIIINKKRVKNNESDDNGGSDLGV